MPKEGLLINRLTVVFPSPFETEMTFVCILGRERLSLLFIILLSSVWAW